MARSLESLFVTTEVLEEDVNMQEAAESLLLLLNSYEDQQPQQQQPQPQQQQEEEEEDEEVGSMVPYQHVWSVSGTLSLFMFNWLFIPEHMDPFVDFSYEVPLRFAELEQPLLLNMLLLATRGERLPIRWCQTGYVIGGVIREKVTLVCEQCLLSAARRIWTHEDQNAIVYSFHLHDFYHFHCTICHHHLQTIQNHNSLNCQPVSSCIALAVSNMFEM